MTRSLKFALPLLLLSTTTAAVAQEPTAPPETGPITRQTANRESPLLDFEYSWPHAISSETRLVAQLSEDLSKNYDEALKNARENKTDMEKFGGPFHQNLFTRTWTLEGQTARLTSLVSGTDTFTGGAHPNHTSSALLWDRSAGQQVQLANLFASADGLSDAVLDQFCKLLDAERAKRRQGEELEGEFSQCPALSELTIAPTGKDGGGRFDSILLIADPYVAGPYSEGSYEVRVPVSAALIAALKPESRGDFQAQRAQ
jgi:hypothetical protein